MKKRLFILTCILSISMVTACGTTESVEGEAAAESQVVEASVSEASEESVEVSTEETVENAQEEVVQSSQESVEVPSESQVEESTATKGEWPEGYDSSKYTWRQTTAERNLYFMEGDEELIGKMHVGETFEEVLQMAEDPTCDFDEENFFNDTVFEGIKVEQVQYLVDNCYDLDSLVNRIVQEGKKNVLELDIWQ